MGAELLPCPFCGGEARTFDLNGTAQATCGGKHIDCAGTDVVAPVAMWNRRTPAPEGEAIGTAGAMPGTSGFTTAVFRANAVPVGTPLYASPVVPTPEEDEDFNSYLIEDRLEMTARASASSVFACRLMDEAAEKIKELRTAILYASPVVPKTADEIKAVVMAWLDADDPASWGDFEKRLNAVVSDEASPVVPVGREEALPPITLDGPHKIGEHRQWLARQLLDSRQDDAEAYSTVIYSPAMTDIWRDDVVPVGVSREEIARIISETFEGGGGGAASGHDFEWDHDEALVLAQQAADAILAALRLTNTGWRDIATAPRDGGDILILASGMAIEACYAPGAWGPDVPGEVQEYDGPVWVAFDGLTQFEIEEGVLEGGQDHHGAVTHWRPRLPPPTDTGRE